jgi:N-acetylmuramoyl-L-alanine amidase
MNTVISSGHGQYIRGAAGPEPWGLDEVDEARRVVGEVATMLKNVGVGVIVLHDNQSHSQSDNLDWIVDHHNALTRDLDVSVHFNCFDGSAHGCEVLYVSQQALAKKVVDAICEASGLTNRGPKKRTDLKFLNATEEPAVLLEVAFVDNKSDADTYRANLSQICTAIAESLSGVPQDALPPEPVLPPPVTETPAKPTVVITVTGNAIEFTVDPPDSVNVVVVPASESTTQ